MKIEYLYYWEGKDINTLSKEELLEAVKWLGSQYQEYMSIDAMKERAVGRMEIYKQENNKR